VTTRELRQYLKQMSSDGTASTSCARRLAGLRRFFRWLMSAQLRGDNPARHLRLSSSRPAPRTVPSYKQLVTLIETPPRDTLLGLRDRAILELLYGAGLRSAELVGLDLDDVDMSGRMLRVMGKRQKQRLCPINTTALRALAAYLERRGPLRGGGRAAVFLGCQGRRLRPQGVWYCLQRWAAVANLPGLSPHGLRHAYATHLHHSGATLEDIRLLLGHSNLRSTQLYLHVSLEQLQEVYRRAHPRADATKAQKPGVPCGIARCEPAESPADSSAVLSAHGKRKTASLSAAQWMGDECPTAQHP